MKRTKWATRGWTYQEGLLSKRRLIFTDEQVLWECNSMHCRESLVLPLNVMHDKCRKRFKVDVAPGTFSHKNPGNKPWKIMSYVAEYTQRQLTYPQDALNTMQGIFRHFATSQQPLHQVMGIPILPASQSFGTQSWSPEEGFSIGFSWFHKKSATRNSSFPSWSWAGWTGEVDGMLLFNKEYSMFTRTKI